MVKSLTAKQKEISSTRQEDFSKLESNLNKLKKLEQDINKLQQPDMIRSLSALERLNNQRAIDGKSKEIITLVKDSKILLPSANKQLNIEIGKTLRKYEQTHSKGIERNL
ncbi:hypothetical protein VAEKB19_100001 [Vibrio aestuarianus]|nr:hypothetical protein VAEKB19_100001 [Vibrio aestuarianus]